MKPSITTSIRYVLCLLAVVTLSACGSNPKQTGGINGSGGSNGEGASTSSVNIVDADGIPVDPNSVAGRAPAERIIYFDFDTSEIRAEYLDVIVQRPYG